MSAHPLNQRRGRISGLQTLSQRGARLACGVLLAAAVACGGDATGPEPIEGTYTRQTIAGRALPIVVEQYGDDTAEITAGALTLSAGSAFTVNFTIRVTSGAQVGTGTSTTIGTWSQSGATLTLNTSDGDSMSVAVSGRTLPFIEDAVSLGSRHGCSASSESLGATAPPAVVCSPGRAKPEQ